MIIKDFLHIIKIKKPCSSLIKTFLQRKGTHYKVKQLKLQEFIDQKKRVDKDRNYRYFRTSSKGSPKT
jgi:hypothetical protein